MAQRRDNIEPNDEKELHYWMGRIDATIQSLNNTLLDFINKNEVRWSEFELWRRQVDERLHSGSNKFEDHSRRILLLEEGAKNNGKSKPSDAKFGTWEWFRDKYLEKGVYIVLSLAFYKLIEMVVTYWASLIK